MDDTVNKEEGPPQPSVTNTKQPNDLSVNCQNQKPADVKSHTLLTIPVSDTTPVSAATSPSQSCSVSLSTQADVINQGLSEGPRRFVCHVQNCEAEFSSEGGLGHHMNIFEHSPCNPFLKVNNCKLSPDALFHMCPECDATFMLKDYCREHQEATNHFVSLPPLAIVGYMCAQCIYVFENKNACKKHISKYGSSHRNICHIFKEVLIRDLISKCKKVKYRVHCLECSLELNTAAKLRQHRLETNNQHVAIVTADRSIVDVFAGYLTMYKCGTCKCLLDGDSKQVAKHVCSKGVRGLVSRNSTSPFRMFPKHLAVTLLRWSERLLKERRRKKREKKRKKKLLSSCLQTPVLTDEVIVLGDSPLPPVLDRKSPSLDDEVIILDESPLPPVTDIKKMCKDGTGDEMSRVPNHPLLESLTNRFQQNRQNREMKEAIQIAKRESELAHSQFIQKNVASPLEMAKANYVVGHWTKVNELKNRKVRKLGCMERKQQYKPELLKKSESITANPMVKNSEIMSRSNGCHNSSASSFTHQSPTEQSTSQYRAEPHSPTEQSTSQYRARHISGLLDTEKTPALTNEVIVLDDSPLPPVIDRKRKGEMETEVEVSRSPKRPYLESITNRFSKNGQDMKFIAKPVEMKKNDCVDGQVID